MDKLQKQKYLEFQELNAELKQLQQQILALEQQLLETRMLVESIDDIRKVKVGDVILAPLGNGVFIKTKLADNSNFVLSVGSGATTEKNADDAKLLLQQQQNELERVIKELSAEFQHGLQRIQQIQLELKQKA